MQCDWRRHSIVVKNSPPPFISSQRKIAIRPRDSARPSHCQQKCGRDGLKRLPATANMFKTGTTPHIWLAAQ